VLVLATLGAPQRHRLRDRRRRAVAPEPTATPVTTARATIVDAQPVPPAEAERWVAQAGQETVAPALAQLARAVRAHRLASGDPAVHEPTLAQALVVRIGHGDGEQVAAGRWAAARELSPAPPPRRRRAVGLQPHERLAALLGGHERPLACEELVLRARHDCDHGHLTQAAFQLRAALDAALQELTDDAARDMTTRLAELAEHRARLEALTAPSAGGMLPPDAGEIVTTALHRVEAALRARTAPHTHPRLER